MQTDRAKAAVHPDLAAILAEFAARGLVTPDPAVAGIAEARRVNEAYFQAIGEPRAEVAEVSVVTARTTDGHDAEVKVALPQAMRPGAPALLYCHGGGYTFGDITTHDHVIRAFAAATGMAVFGLHYRRTPEHAFPKALDDAVAAVSAMRSPEWTARFGHDPAKLFIVGDSAGAHLALTTMLALKKRGRPQVQGAALIYGMYARRFDTWSHHTYGDGSQGLSSQKMRWFWDQLMGPEDSTDDILKEPLDASLSGLPRLALFAAEVDCLLDDTLDFRENCKRQDHPHSFDLFRGMPHGFMHLSSVYAGTREALAVVAGRLKAMAA